MERKSKLQMIAVDKLHPHPQNPRKVIGDVTELAESIKANGILQNLTVVPNNDDWDELVEQAEEIDERCEALRIGFMLDTNFNDSSKKQELVKFIVAQVAAGASRNAHRFSEVVENQDAENIDNYINEHWDDNSGRMLMATAYALCQRTYEKLSFIYVGYSNKTISRKNSPDLNKFYALLCKLGYVMSDEEIQLRDGTHPIFTTGEVK